MWWMFGEKETMKAAKTNGRNSLVVDSSSCHLSQPTWTFSTLIPITAVWFRPKLYRAKK
jgi:hypothetical protein